MRKCILLALISLFAFPKKNSAQDYYGEALREHWLSQAEASKPKLHYSTNYPINIVRLTADPKSFQGWKTQIVRSLSGLDLKPFALQNNHAIDFGAHLTGYFSCSLSAAKNTLHGPLRLKLIFAEVPGEAATPFDPFPGTLSRAWLQDEIVTITELPAKINLPRRLSFRYLKIEVLAKPSNFDFNISDLKFESSTSVLNPPSPLSPTASALISGIDKIRPVDFKRMYADRL